jgi:alpha-glucoside transport system substrate-binding protein
MVLYLVVVATMGGVLGPVFVPEPVLNVTVNPSVLATWIGPEETTFQTILSQFESQQHVMVSYHTANQDLPLVLNQALMAGTAPDVAILPQPGELQELARKHLIQPLDRYVNRSAMDDVDPLWRSFGMYGSSLYGVYFKVADKSVVWYRPNLFRRAGIGSPPTTWGELIADATRLMTAHITPFAMCGASGWSLTDWFENLYLQTAGPARYAKLAHHTIPWTDPSVGVALGLMAQAFVPDFAAGGLTGILTTAYPDCVDLAFPRDSQVAMVMEGDFVQIEIASLDPTLRPGRGGDYDAFPFPSAGPPGPAPVVVGGDVAVMVHDSPQAEKLLAYLATADAGQIWAQKGGFISPHRRVSPDRYPNEVSRRLAAQVTKGSPLEYDLSDQAPAGFGSTIGQGEWADLQGWLSTPQPGDPGAIAAVQRSLEDAAGKAYWPP